jgi:hypothetical protein
VLKEVGNASNDYFYHCTHTKQNDLTLRIKCVKTFKENPFYSHIKHNKMDRLKVQKQT